jgi:hypothetical protein
MAREGREAVDKIRGRGDPAKFEEEGYQSADRQEGGYGSDLHDSGRVYPDENQEEGGGGSSGFNWLRMQMGL